MKLNLPKTQSISFRGRVTYGVGIALVLFIALQFGILATLGTKGGEIATIRAQMEELRIQNETIRADIDKVKTVDNIQSDIAEVFPLRPTSVEKVVVDSGVQATGADNVVGLNP